MDCHEVDKFLQVFIDGELDEVDRSLLEHHLHDCASCRARADYERRFLAAVKARVPTLRAPRRLRDAVEQVLSTPARPARRWLWGSLPAAAALLAVITFTWTVTSGFAPVVSEAIKQHSLTDQVELAAHDPTEVENWFRRRVDFHVALPAFPSAKLALLGAGLSRLAEHRAAVVRYARGPERYSLFVFNDPGQDLPGQACQRVRSLKVCLSEQKGYTVLMWRSRGLVYSFVGDTPPRQMLGILAGASGVE